MLTPRENSLAIMKGEQPDYYGDFMDTIRFIPDPIFAANMVPQDGKVHLDTWGTAKVFLPGAPGAHPHITDENVVIKDIEEWDKYLKVPSVEGYDWTECIKAAEEIDREQHFVALFCATGLFERSHFLLGMEEALVDYLEYPEEMEALLREIAEYKKAQIRLTAELCHPDVIFYQDDWGSKQNLFLPPRVWQDIIKPIQMEVADVIRECGMIYVHHADCVCQPIVEDMVDLGVDLWQGVVPANDIVEIQRITQGKLNMIGGIDEPRIDIEGLSEEEIRAEVRRAVDTYCPAGHFFPGFPSGGCLIGRNNEIAHDELAVYGKKWAQDHPIV